MPNVTMTHLITFNYNTSCKKIIPTNNTFKPTVKIVKHSCTMFFIFYLILAVRVDFFAEKRINTFDISLFT